MLKVGITGGMGSGKTTICRIFQALAVPVYYADDRAKILIREHPEIIKGYKNIFGEDIYKNGGDLNKQKVARKIFADKKILEQVNDLVHPVVRDDFFKWAEKQNSAYIVEEAAVLLEGGGQKFLDKVILVSAPQEVRINRVVSRDNTDRQQVLQRIKNQWTDAQKRPFCDYEIITDEHQLVVPQVLQIHEELIE